MPTNLQSRTQHLALAEFCQSVISPLCDYVDGRRDLPTVELEKARAALQSVKSGDPFKFGQPAAAALGSYEQVRTLEEVWRTPPQLEGVLALMDDLLAHSGGGENARRAKAKKVIRLFLKLQQRALWNFEQPTQTAPPDVGELCQALGIA